MALRTARERFYQTLAYEAGGLIAAAPLYGAIFGREAGKSFALIMTLSLVVMIWAPLHNTIFDWVEFERTGASPATGRRGCAQRMRSASKSPPPPSLCRLSWRWAATVSGRRCPLILA